MSSAYANSTRQPAGRSDSFRTDNTASEPDVPTWYRAVTAPFAGANPAGGALVLAVPGDAVVACGDGVRVLRDGRGDAVRR
ncbi:hypothetical protein ABZU42_29790, partial [Micromonospora profundi]|uniref:hypothetical protein n=1 Tax=Micromonospora profundi TaxID=1420889 RepID=UPI0033B35D26